MEATPKTIKSQTLLRGLDIIEVVARTPMSIPDIAEATGVTYPTAHRIVSVLTERRYLKQTGNRTFGLGPKVIELGFTAYQQADVAAVARPFLIDLARATSDTVHLARIEDGEVIYMDKLQSRRPIEISSRIGGRKPAISTGVGKALLLDDSEDEWRRLYQRDNHLMRLAMSEADWMATMRGYRAAGSAFDLGEDERQIRCVAAPLRDGSGRIVAAISVSSTLDYMPMERMQALVSVVTQTAAVISRDLGFVAG
ncbi:DNA-binding IclR family transcriptional regulator [Rhodobacteraceae bacterium MBR-64]|jgi:DNA-binding IclR family transcriptional regulator